MKDANHSKKIDSILNEELPVGDEENLKSTSDKTIDISGKRFETINEAVEEDIKEENDLKEKAKKDGDKKYKYFIYLALILIITCIVVLYNLFKTTDQIDPNDGHTMTVLEFLPSMIKGMNIPYFLIFFGSIILGILGNSLSLLLFAKLYTRHYKYHQAVANTMIGGFYSAITPGSSGGQFAQVITFKKQGMPVANSASIFVMSFIVYQTVLIFMGVISLIFGFKDVTKIEIIPITIGDFAFSIPMWIFIAFGFLLNLIVILALFFMSYSRKFQNFILNFVVGLLAKMHIIKDPETKRRNIRIHVENYRIELRRLQSNIPFTLLISFITFLLLINTNLQPFLCGISLNAFDFSNINVFEKMFQSVIYSNFHQMVTGLIPIPGSAGISEIVFSSLFGATSGYFTESFYGIGGISILLLFWRFMTFNIPFIVNGIVAATYKSRGLPVKERIIPVGNRTTMLTIQLETFNERKLTSDIAYETAVHDRKELLSKVKESKKRKNSNKNHKKVKKDEGEKE